MDSQDAIDSFGPLVGDEDLKYQIASFHKGLEVSPDSRLEPKAIAICNGFGRYQEGVDSSMFHFVLKPDSELIPGLPIKYIIYRNILKTSVVNISNNQIKSIGVTDQLINANPSITDPNALGLAFRSLSSSSAPSEGYARENIDDIRTIFFENTETKPLVVQAGQSIGVFNKNKFSIQIVLDNSLYSNKLELVRDTNSPSTFLIDLSSCTELEAKFRRERILNFLDPCAF
ncbi:MAG TPA: hypothetical protein VGF79_16615, partial [Bacteroidia bacterium]